MKIIPYALAISLGACTPPLAPAQMGQGIKMTMKCKGLEETMEMFREEGMVQTWTGNSGIPGIYMALMEREDGVWNLIHFNTLDIKACLVAAGNEGKYENAEDQESEN